MFASSGWRASSVFFGVKHYFYFMSINTKNTASHKYTVQKAGVLLGPFQKSLNILF